MHPLSSQQADKKVTEALGLAEFRSKAIIALASMS
jgi:hypothetical protein